MIMKCSFPAFQEVPAVSSCLALKIQPKNTFWRLKCARQWRQSCVNERPTVTAVKYIFQCPLTVVLTVSDERHNPWCHENHTRVWMYCQRRLVAPASRALMKVVEMIRCTEKATSSSCKYCGHIGILPESLRLQD